MSLPDVTIEILANGLGQLPASVANISVKLGICSAGTPNTIYSFSDSSDAQTQLGQGPLMEALADTLGVAGGPVMAVPLNPTTAGSAAATTDNSGVTGAGTVTSTSAPAKTIDLKIVTGGALGTMTVSYRLNGGAYSAPTTSTITSFAFSVPGTLTVATFTAHTYTANDVWTISTVGAITVVGSGTAGWVTQVSSPLDAYDVRVHITTGGGLGAGIFTYSIDGDNNTSGQILIPASTGAYAIPNTGVVLTFSNATFVALDVYKLTTTTATFGTSDVTNAVVVLRGSPIEWGFLHVIGMGSNAAAAASMASTIDTQMTACETEFRYVFGAMECPTSGEADSALASAFVSFASARVMVCAGDIGHRSVLTGRVLRRNSAWVITSRIAAIQPGEHPGWVGSPEGALHNVVSLYANGGGATKWNPATLDAQRFATLRQHIGLAGYYVTRGNMMAASGSDFASVMNRRVMDVACRVTRAGLLPHLNQALTVDSAGAIFEPEARAIENGLSSNLRDALVATRDASAASVVVNRTSNILSTHILPVSVRVRPKGYAETIAVSIGFENPALQLAA